jgi:hypothetical protein
MWYFKGSPVKELADTPEGSIGFIYKITNNTTGKFYIGKKILQTTRKTKIGVREKAATGTRKKFKYVVKESDWKKYYGSSKELLADIKELGEANFHREILEFCCKKKYMTYSEIAYQIKEDVLTKNSYNGNIMGRYYKKDMENC